MLKPSSLEAPMKNGGVFHQLSAAPPCADVWQALFRRLGEAINRATRLEELFRHLAETARDILPHYMTSLAVRTADGKFVRAQLVACQDRILTPMTQMPFRRFCRAVKLPDGKRYLERVPAKLWPLLFPNLAHPTPTPHLPDLAHNNQTLNLEVRGQGFTPPELLREVPPLGVLSNESNGAALNRLIEAESGSTDFTAWQSYPSALLVPLRALSAFSIDALTFQSLSGAQNGETTTFRHSAVSATPPELTFGCLALISRQANAFLPPHGDWLVALADLLVAGIHKVQLLQERARTFFGFRQFVDVSEEMGTATDLDTALQKIAQAAVHALQIPLASVAALELTTIGDLEQSTISHLNEKGGVAADERLAVAHAENTEAPREAVSFPLRKTRGLVKRLLSHRPIVVRDIAKSQMFSDTAKTLLAQHHLQSYFGMPIFLDRRAGQEPNACATPLALLNLYARVPHELNQLDMTMLRALAAFTAQVLEKVRLSHQLDKSKAYFDGLRRSAMEELENFVYVISHNLKTPVVSIQGFANILQEEVGPGLEIEHQHFLERIRKNAAAMEKMVLDLLEFSRLGRAALKLEHVNIRELAQSVIDEMCLLGQAGEVEFVLPRHSAGLPSVLADGAELKTVFENLFNNAVKYRRPGAPLRIEIGWEEQPRFHVFWVRDNGMGMDPEFQVKAFDLFQRGPNVAQIPGTGIGLAIVRRIVENHRGLVRLHSKLGAGTTIYFTLPKIEALSSSEPADTAPTH